MKCLKRNQQSFYYCLYQGAERYVDESGIESGEKIVLYDDAVPMQANISAASGYSQTEQFGHLDNYDKVIVTCDVDCPIDENTVLFIGKEPEYTTAETHKQENDEWVSVEYQIPVYNYTVRRIAKSLNSVSIAISKVDVS